MSKPFKSNMIDVSHKEALLHRQPGSGFRIMNRIMLKTWSKSLMKCEGVGALLSTFMNSTQLWRAL